MWRKAAIKIRSSSRVFVRFLNAFARPGLGAEGSTSFASCFAGSWASVVVFASLPAHLLPWGCAVETSSYAQLMGSTGRLCAAHHRFSLAGCICLSLLHSTGSTEEIPCLLLPSSFPGLCFLSCKRQTDGPSEAGVWEWLQHKHLVSVRSFPSLRGGGDCPRVGQCPSPAAAAARVPGKCMSLNSFMMVPG